MKLVSTNSNKSQNNLHKYEVHIRRYYPESKGPDVKIRRYANLIIDTLMMDPRGVKKQKRELVFLQLVKEQRRIDYQAFYLAWGIAQNYLTGNPRLGRLHACSSFIFNKN